MRFLVLIFWFLVGVCTQNFAIGKDISCQKGRAFEDILLVVNYNHPFYGSMEFIRSLYADFPNIVFYGETLCQTNPQAVIQVSTTNGYLFTRVVADVLKRFPQYRGYIFLQDDVLMNFWHFKRLNKDKIWLGLDIYLGKGDVPATWKPDYPRWKLRLPLLFSNNGWYWWNTPYGDVPLNKALSRLNDRDRQTLIKNLGEFGKTGALCDMFYIPHKFREGALRLSKIFKDVFCEISVPMMLACLDSTENWEHLRGQWALNWDSSEYPGPAYREEADWVHPLKFSKQTARDFALKAAQAHVATKGVKK